MAVNTNAITIQKTDSVMIRLVKDLCIGFWSAELVTQSAAGSDHFRVQLAAQAVDEHLDYI
jgi:hypothetical protein